MLSAVGRAGLGVWLIGHGVHCGRQESSYTGELTLGLEERDRYMLRERGERESESEKQRVRV